jgi:hypothetical protein
VCVAVLSAVLLLIPEKIRKIILQLLCGLLLSFYVQKLFFNGEMASITGDETNYDSYSMSRSINFLLFFAITFTPLITAKWLSEKKIDFNFDKALIFIAVLIFGMQTAGLISVGISSAGAIRHEKTLKYLTYEPALTLGKEDNITVFLLDRLDTTFVQETLENSPELYDELDGFTFYEDNISEFATSFPSIPKLLTGYDYDVNTSYWKYLDEAWAQESYLDVLIENGYDINLLISVDTTYYRYSQFESRANNVKDAGNFSHDFVKIALINLRISSLRILPYYLKETASKGLVSSFANDFYSYEFTDGHAPITSIDTDLNFYNYLKDNGVKMGTGNKTFNFIHLACSHDGGYHYDKQADVITTGGDYLDATRACFEIINMYINDLKSLGEYDNTSIIIMGDHGRLPDIWATEAEELKDYIATGLLVKPSNSRGRLLLDSQSQLSNDNFIPTIMEFAGIPGDDYGYSYYDLIALDNPPKRHLSFFFGFTGLESRGFKDNRGGYYEIDGKGSDFDNWFFTPY